MLTTEECLGMSTRTERFLGDAEITLMHHEVLLLSKRAFSGQNAILLSHMKHGVHPQGKMLKEKLHVVQLVSHRGSFFLYFHQKWLLVASLGGLPNRSSASDASICRENRRSRGSTNEKK